MHLLQCTTPNPTTICGASLEVSARMVRVRRRTKTMSSNSNTMLNRYRRWRRYRETVRELQGLSTRELSDLGIHRNDIGRIARQASQL